MNKKQWIKKLKPYWKAYAKIEDEFHLKVKTLNEKMRKDLKNEDVEFAYNKMGGGLDLYFGIGFGRRERKNVPALLQCSDLED